MKSCVLLPFLCLFLLASPSIGAGEKQSPGRLSPDEAVMVLGPALSGLATELEAKGKQPALDFDGEGSVDGIPCLLFSFGEDDGGNFNVLGQYAVDHSKRVYKLDASGKYQPLVPAAK